MDTNNNNTQLNTLDKDDPIFEVLKTQIEYNNKVFEAYKEKDKNTKVSTVNFDFSSLESHKNSKNLKENKEEN